ncbi:MAG: hypothetical protein JWO68_2779 [Actinomycetia bacterium]|nr:hypothetical protein [Actinomycetes bacterium]
MSGRNSGPVCSSSHRAGVLEDLQFSLGEGPCQDAFATGEPVGEPDLAHAVVARWPSFTPPALATGTRGVFAFPLLAGTSRIGVLTLYQDTAGRLSDEQAADSLVVADVVAQRMLTTQSRSEPDVLAEELIDAGAHRAEVHQASGMVAVQLRVGVAEALVRLRAHAYATGRPVADVAADIVARRLSLGDDRTSGGPG